MASAIAKTSFQGTLDYSSLPSSELKALFLTAIEAHNNFFGLWQDAVRNLCDDSAEADELTALVYPNLESCGQDIVKVFYEEMNFLWMCMPGMESMLTVGTYAEDLLPETFDQGLDLDGLSNEALVLLWNLATLTYVMQTSRWVQVLSPRYDHATALRLEKQIWIERGAAEDDLRFGLIAAGQEKGNVETLLRGFQFAPGEVGLVDAEFTLESPDHGWITHKYCPAHETMQDTDRERLENCCVLCVTAMRISGEMVDENIRCRPASLPPYKDATDHACKWEYWVEK